MATNDFIGFASSGAANVMSQADYAAAHEQLVGVQPGMASSRLANKAWRQGANMAAVIGELIKNHGINALDNGDLTMLYNALLSATASPTLAGLMSAEDKTALDGVPATYLPLSGGTMTGEIKTTNVNLGIKTSTNSELRICGGTGLTDGATVIVYGKDSGNVGGFRIRAYNDHDLIGSSSGVLTWDEKEVTQLLYSNLLPLSFIFENSHNLQIIADRTTASNGTVVNFGRAFASGVIPVVIAQHPGIAANANIRAHSISSTGFTVYSEYSSAIDVNYIAIGKGQ